MKLSILGATLSMEMIEPSATFIFQIINTAVLLMILIGVPFLIIKAIRRSKENRKENKERLIRLEKNVDKLLEKMDR